MPASVTLRVSGLASTVRALVDMGIEVDDLKDALGDIAHRGAFEAAREAPRRTGALAGTARGNRARSKAVISAGYKARVPYAGPINYGWSARNISPNGFMQRAERRLLPYASRALERNINALIRRKGLA